ncbi:MAG: rod shape-determining protein RodA [Clostridia bacterium]|nr:rod shape-determining protein RodA [Clostridia bacterium]
MVKRKKKKGIGVLSLKNEQKISLSKTYDYGLIFCVIVLTCIGAVLCTSAISYFSAFSSMLRNQILSIIVGIVICVVISIMDYDYFKLFGIIGYFVTLGLLVLVLFRGVEIGGAKSWLRLPVLGLFQPSELSKVTTIMVVAIFFGRLRDNEGKPWINVLMMIVTCAIPLGLIAKQNDFGTAMIYIFAIAIMIFMFGIKFRYIFIAGGLGLASLPFLWFNVLKDHQKGRILAVLQPEVFAETYSYNILRAETAISSGGLTGKGMLNGDLTANYYVPVQESDFIFSVAGEEMGFIGCTFLLLLIFGILGWMYWIGFSAKDSYGKFLVVGMTSMLAFQYCENICGCLGIFPLTGIPLPFVSQGGTAMIVNFILLGIVLSVSSRRDRSTHVYDMANTRSYEDSKTISEYS